MVNDDFDMTPPEKLPLDHYAMDYQIVNFVKTTYSYDKDWRMWAGDNHEMVENLFSRPYTYHERNELGLT